MNISGIQMKEHGTIFPTWSRITSRDYRPHTVILSEARRSRRIWAQPNQTTVQHDNNVEYDSRPSPPCSLTLKGIPWLTL